MVFFILSLKKKIMKNTLLFILTLWIVTGHSQSIFELPKQPTAAFMKSYGDDQIMISRNGAIFSITTKDMRDGDVQVWANKKENIAFSASTEEYKKTMRRNVAFGSNAGRSLPPHTKTVSGANNYVLDQGPTSDAVKKGLILVEDTDREYPNAHIGRSPSGKVTARSNTVSVSPAINTENVFIGRYVFIYGNRNIVICNKAKSWMDGLEVSYLFYVDFDCEFLTNKPELKQILWDAQSLPKVERWKVAYKAVNNYFK
jgi:hypothetical protein